MLAVTNLSIELWREIQLFIIFETEYLQVFRDMLCVTIVSHDLRIGMLSHLRAEGWGYLPQRTLFPFFPSSL